MTKSVSYPERRQWRKVVDFVVIVLIISAALALVLVQPDHIVSLSQYV